MRDLSLLQYSGIHLCVTSSFLLGLILPHFSLRFVCQDGEMRVVTLEMFRTAESSQTYSHPYRITGSPAANMAPKLTAVFLYPRTGNVQE